MNWPNYSSKDVAESHARSCAQIRQQLRLARCLHPTDSVIIRLLYDDGYIEYCSDCDKVLSIYEP